MKYSISQLLGFTVEGEGAPDANAEARYSHFAKTAREAGMHRVARHYDDKLAGMKRPAPAAEEPQRSPMPQRQRMDRSLAAA